MLARMNMGVFDSGLGGRIVGVAADGPGADAGGHGILPGGAGGHVSA